MGFKAHTGLPLMSCSALDFDLCHTKTIGGFVLLMLAHTCLHVLTSTLTTANTDTSESREIVNSNSLSDRLRPKLCLLNRRAH
jgi:hypothetical protein